MRVFNALNCGGITPEQFGNLVDFMLVTATAIPMVTAYPVEFGNPPPVIMQVENEFDVLTDWKGRVLTQGFEEDVPE